MDAANCCAVVYHGQTSMRADEALCCVSCVVTATGAGLQEEMLGDLTLLCPWRFHEHQWECCRGMLSMLWQRCVSACCSNAMSAQ